MGFRVWVLGKGFWVLGPGVKKHFFNLGLKRPKAQKKKSRAPKKKEIKRFNVNFGRVGDQLFVGERGSNRMVECSPSWSGRRARRAREGKERRG